MIEFKARLLIDSQDPEIAYGMLRAALRNTTLHIRIDDSWLRNTEPLPADCAQRIALAWHRSKIGHSDQVVFVTADPAVMCELNQMDLFDYANDTRNLAYLRTDEDLGPIEHGKSKVCEAAMDSIGQDEGNDIEGDV